MRDPTIPDPQDRRKLMFYDSTDRQARLRIRCEYDGITQSQFFRMILTGYIENDDLIYEFIKKSKEKYKIQGIQKRNKIEQLRNKGVSLSKQFTLDDEEVEDIFDIIELETDL